MPKEQANLVKRLRKFDEFLGSQVDIYSKKIEEYQQLPPDATIGETPRDAMILRVKERRFFYESTRNKLYEFIPELEEGR